MAIKLGRNDLRRIRRHRVSIHGLEIHWQMLPEFPLYSTQSDKRANFHNIH
jgi:hypothetical protein